MLAAALGLSACGGGSSGGRTPAPATPPVSSQTYGSALTEVKITRTADAQILSVEGLPAQAAELTIP